MIIRNDAYYADKKAKPSQYASICNQCNAKLICQEPDKEHRITCPDNVWDLWNQKLKGVQHEQF